jgi:four helix bundle protein
MNYLFRKNVVSLIRAHFPASEQFCLTAQILNAARSVTANIAEGFGRYHYQENIQFCRQARGSLAETMEHLIAAYDEKYVSKAALSALHQEYKTCLKELNTYTQYLKAAKAGQTNKQ